MRRKKRSFSAIKIWPPKKPHELEVEGSDLGQLTGGPVIKMHFPGAAISLSLSLQRKTVKGRIHELGGSSGKAEFFLAAPSFSHANLFSLFLWCAY